MAKYVYPAIFTSEENGMYSVVFPDVKNCFTSGENLADAIDAAEDALCLMLYDAEESGAPIPPASHLKTVSASPDDIVSLIACDTLEYRKFYHNNAIKKTLTIPAWLNTIAEKNDVNFSQVLQEALKEKLRLG